MSELKTAGYSGTPLPKKLGLKDGQAVAFLDLPASLEGLTSATQFPSVHREAAPGAGLDVVHAFYTSAQKLTAELDKLRAAIRPNGMIWISWPKKAAKMETDITEDVVRRLALARGLVDVKVCAVDEVWSGLKLVIPVKLRG